MAESEKKQVYRRFVEEVINKGNLSVIPELYHPEYVDHSAPPGAAPGQSVFEQVAAIQTMFRGAFPDVHFIIEDMIEYGDWIGTRVTGRGQHIGQPFMGVMPKGHKLAWSSLGFFRIQDGKIIEHFGQPDLLGLYEQISAPIQKGSSDENRAIMMRYFYEGANKGNLSIIDEVFDTNYVHHDPANIDAIGGLDDVRHHITTLRHAFPDLEFHVVDEIADENNIVVRWTVSGTHTGDYFGIPPTGKKFNITGMNHWKLANGKAIEGWVSRDDMGLMRQLGLMPG